MYEEKIKHAFDEIKASDALKQKTESAVLAASTSKKKKPLRMMGTLAAAAAALVLVFAGYSLYMQPTAYIGVDVNPSVELSLNRENKVLSAQAYNEDGKRILENIDLKGLYYQEAIDVLLKQERIDGYLDGDVYAVFSIQSDDEAQEQLLMDGTKQYTNTNGMQTEYITVSGQERQEAHAHGMSQGRYKKALELQAVDPSVSLEDCMHMSMHELNAKIAACAQGHEEYGEGGNDSALQNGQGHGRGHGQGNGQGMQHGKGHAE